MTVERIVCGFQVGADIAGARTGKRLHLEVGGWMPAGYRTKAGNRPDYQYEFNAQCTEERDYPPRTWRNVASADATVRFAHSFKRRGEQLTRRCCELAGKPYYDVPIRHAPLGIYYTLSEPRVFAIWLEARKVRVLNVAGNAIPGIEPVVERFLMEALS